MVQYQHDLTMFSPSSQASWLPSPAVALFKTLGSRKPHSRESSLTLFPYTSKLPLCYGQTLHCRHQPAVLSLNLSP